MVWLSVLLRLEKPNRIPVHNKTTIQPRNETLLLSLREVGIARSMVSLKASMMSWPGLDRSISLRSRSRSHW